VRLYGDDLRIKQVVNNLLSNAFKYTRQGTVEFGMNCEREGGTDTIWVTVFVRDTGIGIHPKDMNRLFENYAKLDTISNRAVDGTGLGLSIARMLIEQMDGKISVESEYGKGSTFTARFRQKFISDEVNGPEISNNLKYLTYVDNKRTVHSQLVRIRLPYARVLVVDDNVTNLDVAKGMMQAYGMKIDCVSGGQQAVDAVRSEHVRYNAIFMDHMMPGMDGVEATRIIREEIGTDYARTVPIIALTANAVIGSKEMFLNKGFQAFISKPIEIAHLDAVIRKWVRDKEKMPDARQIDDGELFPDRRSGKDRRNGNSAYSGNERRAAAGGRNTVDRQTILEIKDISGLDMHEGLARFGGDEKIYQQVLRSYVTNTRLILETVKEITEASLNDYIFAVHGIKASSRGIGANIIGSKAEALEKMAKAGNLNFLRANHPGFLETAENLMLDIEHILGKATAGKPKKDKPDTVIMSMIRAACENYDIDELDAAMADLEACEYESDDGLALWLRENVDRMNYDEIIDKLSSLIDDGEC
jgi:CheY-like chemotaxis protein